MSIDVQALKDATDIVSAVGSYVPLKKQGREYKGLCPFHADTSPSFYVVPEKKFCHCFSCGWSGDVIDFVAAIEGIEFKAACEKLGAAPEWKPRPIKQAAPPLPDRITSKPPAGTAPPEMAIRSLGEPVKTWEYRDTDGGALGYVARYEVEGKKEILCWTWGARGDAAPSWGCGHWNQPRPLYGLDRLAAGDGPVVIVEGEKAVDAAARLLEGYYVACTWPGGANAWHKADWTPLKGRTVLIIPDADEPGWKVADQIARLLSDPRGLACSVRVVDTHGEADGWDVADFAGTTEELIAWAKPRARDYTLQNPDPQDESGAAPADAGSSSSTAAGSPAGSGPSTDDAPPLEAYAGDPAAKPQPKRRRPLLAVVGNAALAEEPDGEILPHELSESGIAAEFVRLHRNTFRTVHQWSGKQGACWMTWDGQRWRREPSRVTAMQRAQILAHGVKYWDAARQISELSRVKFESRKFIGAFLDLASYAPELVAEPGIFDADPWILGTPAGPVDLRAAKLLEPDPELYLSRQTAIAPAEGPHPLFDDVIRRASAGEQEIANYLWLWLGYILTGSVAEECFLYAVGKPQSGKTTLVGAIADILGDTADGGYSSHCDVEMFTESKIDKGNDRLAHLAGARFAYASEMEEGRNFKTALLKMATGGDRLSGRFLYAEKFSFTPSHKLWIIGNHMLHLRSADAGLKRRLHLLEYQDAFIVSDEERDNTFKERLKAEYPAILHSMIRAAQRYIEAGGLGKPERISRAVEDYATNEDTLAQWLEECTEPGQNSRAVAADAYDSFRRWAEKQGAFIPSAKRFSQALTERGYGRIRDARARYFAGFTVKLGANL